MLCCSSHDAVGWGVTEGRTLAFLKAGRLGRGGLLCWGALATAQDAGLQLIHCAEHPPPPSPRLLQPCCGMGWLGLWCLVTGSAASAACSCRVQPTSLCSFPLNPGVDQALPQERRAPVTPSSASRYHRRRSSGSRDERYRSGKALHGALICHCGAGRCAFSLSVRHRFKK